MLLKQYVEISSLAPYQQAPYKQSYALDNAIQVPLIFRVIFSAYEKSGRLKF